MALAVFGLKAVWTSGRHDASALLLDSAKKVHHTDYSGLVETSTVYYGRELKGLTKVYHKGSGDRMEYLSAPAKGTIVVATDSETATFHPHSGKVVVSPTAAQAEEEKKVRLLLSNYSAEMAGEAVVAGRPVLVVDVVPKRNGNPSKKMWIDKKTHIILRQEDRSASGTLKSRMVFKEISYSSNIPASKMELPEGAKKTTRLIKASQPQEAEALSKRLNMKVTKPGYVPSGYQFTG
jgi:outer membrane lipoprotein-sorting protein